MPAEAMMTPTDAVEELFANQFRQGAILEALHPYRQPDASPIFWRVRLRMPDGDKVIRPFHLTDNGYTIGEPKNAGGKPLYGLDRLAQAAPEEAVWITEGEYKADKLHALGLVTVTSGGASSDEAADWSPLEGRSRAVIWPDNDQPGGEYGRRVAAILLDLGLSVELIDVPSIGVQPKGDAVDWLALHPEATAATVEALPRKPIDLDDGLSWGPPLPLAAKLAPESYPLDVLPADIRAAVSEVHDFIQAPLPLISSVALSALSVAAQALFDVERDVGLVGPCGLFLLTVADSGERKTTAESFFMQPISQWEEDQAEAAKPLLERYKSERDGWQDERDGVRSAIKAAKRADKPKGRSVDALRTELAAIDARQPIPPRVPRLLRTDSTPEALGWSLAKHWPSGATVSSEAGAVFGAHGMGTDSIMRTLSLNNILWDGKSHTVGRRTSESYTVHGARLTMGLAVQESTLRKFFAKSGDLARGTGFLARFLIAWPESTQGFRPYRGASGPMPALARFRGVLRALLDRPVPINDDGSLSPPCLSLSSEAHAQWVAFHNLIEAELRPGGQARDVRDVASKSADNAARLAALFHIYQGGAGPIDAESMASGCRLAAWHLTEARRFFGELAMPRSIANAGRLDDWLIERAKSVGVRSIPTGDVLRLGPPGTRDRDELGQALRELAELNRVRERKAGKRRLIDVNPALLRGEDGC